MKKQIPGFLAGMLTMALVGSLGVGALAASGAMTITVDPINIQVNGQTFAPKDATGADVPVFAYNGTTYAPLRALAEAYGLTVGYDQEANMATVEDPSATTTPPSGPAPDATALPADYSGWSAEDEAAYQEFKGWWEIDLPNHTVSYMGPLDRSGFTADWNLNYGTTNCSRLFERFAGEQIPNEYHEHIFDVVYHPGDEQHLGEVKVTSKGVPLCSLNSI